MLLRTHRIDGGKKVKDRKEHIAGNPMAILWMMEEFKYPVDISESIKGSWAIISKQWIVE